MPGIAIHTCKRTDEMGQTLAPDMATCGTCARAWCYACHPTPAGLCPFCNGDTCTAPIPPRQARALRAAR